MSTVLNGLNHKEPEGVRRRFKKLYLDLVKTKGGDEKLDETTKGVARQIVCLMMRCDRLVFQSMTDDENYDPEQHNREQNLLNRTLQMFGYKAPPNEDEAPDATAHDLLDWMKEKFGDPSKERPLD